MKKAVIDFYARLAHGIAVQFGTECEVVVHDLQSRSREHTIIAIENGHVSGRKIGDGPSQAILKSLQNIESVQDDRLAFLTRSRDGKILKSSMICIRDENGTVIGIFEINFDISIMAAAAEQLRVFTGAGSDAALGGPLSTNIADLLEELIEQSARAVGKPVAMMTKEDKVQVVRQLNDVGAFLITKSGPRVCQYLGISKYTLYSYLDEIKSGS